MANNKFHIFLMVYTAVTVVALNIPMGVLSAILIWAVFSRYFDKPGGCR